MDYKGQAHMLRRHYLDYMEGIIFQRLDVVCKDCNLAATSITDLLARAEAAERERDRLREVLDMYGGEYGITEALKAAEARVHELETTHRVEMCEDGYDCVELGKVRRKLEEAEVREEKVERERNSVKKNSHYCRGVIATAPDGTQATYPSVSAAAEQIGGQVSRITYACRTGTLYRGILWRYADED